MPTSDFSFKNASVIIFLVLCLIYFAGTGYAQKTPDRNAIVVRFANSDSLHIPLKQILANPTLTVAEPGCEITDFTISFMPDGGEFKGPFKTPHAKVTENNLNYLAAFNNMKVRIFIENIHLKCNGKETEGQAVVRISVP